MSFTFVSGHRGRQNSPCVTASCFETRVSCGVKSMWRWLQQSRKRAGGEEMLSLY